MILKNENWSLIQPVTDKGTMLGFIAIHRGTTQHPAFGATRIKPYPTTSLALKDALDLSWLMSHKAALANIPYGGGKGVLFDGAHMKTEAGRNHALDVYAQHVNLLGGKFITGSDVGVSQSDVDFMRTKSPYIVGIKENPTERTAEGLFGSIQVVSEEFFHTQKLSDLSFAIQGMGKVGSAILELLYDRAKKIIIADVDVEKIQALQKKYPDILVCSPDEILAQEVDIFVPCAFGDVFNAKSIPTIKARALVGSANNQLADDSAGDMLHARGILYAPDYVVNAGGLISVVHEFEKNNNTEKLDDKIYAIRKELRDILQESRATNTPTHKIANNVANKKINDLFHYAKFTE